MQIGSLSSEVVLSFEEPWLFQKQLGLGFSVFRTSSEYNSTFYTQIQTGFEIYLRKHLWELWNGRLSYTYEIFDIQDISPSASPIIQALAGANASSSIGLQLQRDIVDHAPGLGADILFAEIGLAGGIEGQGAGHEHQLAALDRLGIGPDRLGRVGGFNQGLFGKSGCRDQQQSGGNRGAHYSGSPSDRGEPRLSRAARQEVPKLEDRKSYFTRPKRLL